MMFPLFGNLQVSNADPLCTTLVHVWDCLTLASSEIRSTADASRSDSCCLVTCHTLTRMITRRVARNLARTARFAATPQAAPPAAAPRRRALQCHGVSVNRAFASTSCSTVPQGAASTCADAEPYRTRIEDAVDGFVVPRAHPPAAVQAATTSTHGPLSLEQVNCFADQGFLMLRGVLAPEELDPVASAVQRLQDDHDAGTLHDHVLTITEPHTSALRSVFQVHKGTSPDDAAIAAERRAAAALGHAAEPEDTIAAALHHPFLVEAAEQVQ